MPLSSRAEGDPSNSPSPAAGRRVLSSRPSTPNVPAVVMPACSGLAPKIIPRPVDPAGCRASSGRARDARNRTRHDLRRARRRGARPCADRRHCAGCGRRASAVLGAARPICRSGRGGAMQRKPPMSARSDFRRIRRCAISARPDDIGQTAAPIAEPESTIRLARPRCRPRAPAPLRPVQIVIAGDSGRL